MEQAQAAEGSAVRTAHELLTGMLRGWAGDRPVTVGAAEVDREGIVATPLALLADEAMRSTRSSSIGLRVRYAVSVPAGDLDGLEVLERLVVAASRQAELALVDAAAVVAWQDRGVPVGRVGCVVDVLARHHQQPPSAPAVRQPLQVDLGPLRTLAGRVLTRSGTPLPAVRVSAGLDGTAAVTDDDGRFRLSAVEAGPTTLWLEVKGRRFPAASTTGPDEQHLEVVIDDG